MYNRVVVESSFPYAAKDKKKIQRAVSGALKLIKYKSAFVSVSLVTNKEIASLNRRFRGKRSAATVLSFNSSEGFPQPHLPKGTRFLGDIYISPKYTLRIGENIERLAVHGTLHLVGYTHGKLRDRINMERLEKRIVKRLGI